MANKATIQFVKKLAELGYATHPAKSFKESLNKFTFNLTRYNHYGLYQDDIIYETPLVKEAIKRLPADVQQERHWRFARALDHSFKKTILPKAEWTTYENDQGYLRGYIAQIEREEQERADWDNGNITL